MAQRNTRSRIGSCVPHHAPNVQLVSIGRLVRATRVRPENFTTEIAIPELQGINVLLGTGLFSSTELSNGLRSQFDFVDIPIDTTQPDVAASFEGVSGGGLLEGLYF
jgi:hypothetical protein